MLVLAGVGAESGCHERLRFEHIPILIARLLPRVVVLVVSHAQATEPDHEPRLAESAGLLSLGRCKRGQQFWRHLRCHRR